MSSGKLIFNNKYLINYILEFDDTYKKIFKNKLVFSRNILEGAHVYWFNRYEKELLSGGNYALDFQDIYFDTLYLWNPDLANSIRYTTLY
jgi:hypothetical protein